MKTDKIELFDELYSCYYSTVNHILRTASNRELTDAELRKLISETSDTYGFPATTSFIIGGAIDAGKNEEAAEDKDAWPFFDRIEGERHRSIATAGRTVNKSRFNNISAIPLSKVEKMWLKSIFSDPRIRLFLKEDPVFPDLQDVEPLFDWDDYVLFDQYSNGDPYQDEHYIEMFRKVLKAVHNHSRLKIQFRKTNNKLCFNQDDSYMHMADQATGIIYLDADHLEYSERDNKFRLIGNNPLFGRNMVNVASIVSCDEVEKTEEITCDKQNLKEAFQKKAVFELTDDRNALERFLLNFSHCEKETEYLKDRKQYHITVYYDEVDEKDVVIRVLSFGPYVKAVEPECFVELIRKKLLQQLTLFEDP